MCGLQHIENPNMFVYNLSINSNQAWVSFQGFSEAYNVALDVPKDMGMSKLLSVTHIAKLFLLC